MFGFGRKKEARDITQASGDRDKIFALFGGMPSSVGVTVNVTNALGVPSVWAAVNFMSGTLAGLPLHVYRKNRDGTRKRVTAGVAPILHDAVNDGMSSFEWRKCVFDSVFTHGRSVTYIERTNGGRVENLYPLDVKRLSVKTQNGRKVYEYKPEAGPVIRYEATDVIDLTFMLESDMVTHISPISRNREAIAMAIAATKYGGKVFNNGGVPPLVLQGPFQSAAGAMRASDDIRDAMARGAEEGERNILAMPLGHELKPVGLDAEKMQLIDLKRFSVEEIARIYSLPPVFLQDLTHGTFSNTEQQDLHFVKHTLKRWIEQAEQEMNLKLFGRGANQYVEFNVDGLLRGDFKTRMDAHATSIQNGIRTPNEVRELENLEARPEGDSLLIQGATVPIGQANTGQNDEE